MRIFTQIGWVTILLFGCAAAEPRRHYDDEAIPSAFRENLAPFMTLQPAPAFSAGDTAGAERLLREEKALPPAESYADQRKRIEHYFEPAVRLDPGSVRARSLLVIAYLDLLGEAPRDAGSFATLRGLLEPAPARGATPEEFVLAKAKYLRAFERDEEAEELVQEALLGRQTPGLHAELGWIAAGRGDWAKARILLRAAASEQESAMSRYGELLAAVHEETDSLETLGLADRFVSEHPAFDGGHLLRAVLLVRAKRPVEALGSFRRIRYLDSGRRANTLPFLLQALADSGNKDAAIRFGSDQDDEASRRIVYRLRAERPGREHDAYVLLSDGLAKCATQKSPSASCDASPFVRASEVDRHDAEPFTVAAETYLGNGDLANAVDRFQRAIATPAPPIRARYGLVRAALASLDLDVAERALAELSQSDARAEWLRGVLEQKRMQSQAAGEAHMLQAVAFGAAFPEVYMALGELEQERKNYDLAELYFSAAIGFAPDNPEALLGLGVARFHRDSPSRAIAFLKRKAAALPGSAPVLADLAILYLRAGDQLNGKNNLQNAIRSDRHYAQAFRLLGDLTKDEGNRNSDYNAKRHSYRYALASYEMYSGLRPLDPEGYKATADLYFDIRDLGAAAKNYHKVLELIPNYPGVRLRLAQISRNGGDSGRAMQLLEDEIKINVKSDNAWVEKGNIFMAMKDFMPAMEAFRQAARINEKNVDALFGIGVIYHLQGSYDNALSLFARVTRLDPLKEDTYWQKGLIYQKLGNSTLARQAFLNYREGVRDGNELAKVDEKLRQLAPPMDKDPPKLLPRDSAQAQQPAQPPQVDSLFELISFRSRLFTPRLFGVGSSSASGTPHGFRGDKIFMNQYVEFRVPDGWECELDGAAQWVCQNADEQKKRDAILIFAAKTRIPGLDELPFYRYQLEQPRSYQSLSGEAITSEPKYVVERIFSGQSWLEALQLQSEIPDFYTRYFATTKADLGIVLAFSVRKDKYDEYLADVEELVKSLRAVNGEPLASRPSADAGASPLTGLRIVVHAAYEELPAAHRTEVDGAYADVIHDFEGKDYQRMRADLNRLLSFVSEYKDSRFYERIAARGVDELQADRRQRERDAAITRVREEITSLEKEGAGLLPRALKESAARTELESLYVKIYAKDPNNRLVGKWKQEIQVVIDEAARRKTASPPRKRALK